MAVWYHFHICTQISEVCLQGLLPDKLSKDVLNFDESMYFNPEDKLLPLVST